MATGETNVVVEEEVTAHKMKKTTKKWEDGDEDTDEPTTTGIVLAEDS